jgi:hypothetical protein
MELRQGQRIAGHGVDERDDDDRCEEQQQNVHPAALDLADGLAEQSREREAEESNSEAHVTPPGGGAVGAGHGQHDARHVARL